MCHNCHYHYHCSHYCAATRYIQGHIYKFIIIQYNPMISPVALSIGINKPEQVVQESDGGLGTNRNWYVKIWKVLRVLIICNAISNCEEQKSCILVSSAIVTDMWKNYILSIICCCITWLIAIWFLVKVQDSWTGMWK